MLITRQSPISGQIYNLEIDITMAQLNAWKNGALIQEAMPELSIDEREFIVTGIPPNEWDELMKEEDDA